MRTRVWVVAAAAAALACGGDDGGSSTAGTCDFTQVETRRTCLEQSGNALDIASQHQACEENAGTWTAAACPVNADLIGCCVYEFGLAFRECFYTRPERTYDPQSVCTSSTFDGVPGVWTSAPPP